MNIKEYLNNLLNDFREQRSTLRTSLVAAETQEERQAINESLDAVEKQIESVNEQIRSLPEEDGTGNGANGEQRGFNPLASYGLNMNGAAAAAGEQEREAHPTETMEYRKAFQKYFRTGEMNEVLITRANEVNTSEDLGVVIPVTVMQTFITEVEKVRGQLYTKVKKTNVKGGMKYPIGAFGATFKRITEGTVSDRQKGGKTTGHVQFGYNIGEIRIAKTLLETILETAAFETELGKVIAKAYVEAMDKEIISGVPANNEMEGILTEAKKESGSRILPANIITFTVDDINDWAAWEKKLFAEIPMAMEKERPEFVMAKQTYVSNLCTMKDTSGQPIKKAGFDASDKLHKFNEYEVNRVEKDIFKDFDSCADGEYFGMFWVPEMAYAINSNMEFTLMRYFDHETNQFVDKALVVNDGKVLDPAYIYLLKKSVPAQG